MSTKRNANILITCPWLTETNGKSTDCIQEFCPYYDLEPVTRIINDTGGTKTFYLQSCIRVHQQSVELEIIENIFRELTKLLKEEK